MVQVIESRKGFSSDTSQRAMKYANRAMFDGFKERDRKRLEARNAYRRAAGLPEIKSS